MTGRAHSPASPQLTVAVASTLIVAGALAAYANSFSGPFVFDDVPSIRDNPAIRSLGSIWSASANPGLTTGGRPLVALSLAVNYALSGNAVWSYHALNLVIHILAALTLLGIARRTLARNESLATSATTAERVPSDALAKEGASVSPEARAARLSSNAPTALAFAIALLWAVHPLQTESVTYVIQRAESLMGLFYLLTLYCFIRSVDADEETKRWGVVPPAGALQGDGGTTRQRFIRPRWAVLSVFACLLGMACKEVMVSAPLIIFLYDRTFIAGTFAEAWRRRWRWHLALASTWILLFCLAATNGDRGRTAGFDAGVVWWRYALAQFPAMVRYLGLSAWPHPLVFDYGRDLADLAAAAAPCALIVIALLAATLIALVRRPALGFLGACFFAVLAPTSSVLPVATEVVAEHRMYLPLGAVVVFAVLAGRKLRPAIFYLLIAMLAAGLGFATAERNRDYRSDLALWEKTAAQRPDNADAQYNFGFALDRAGRTGEAEGRYAEAVRLAPEFAQAQNNLAMDLDRLGRSDEALSHFESAARLRPDLVETQNDLGNLLLRLGRVDEAIAHYGAALQWRPNYPLTHLNLGLALTRAERLDEAEKEFLLALQLQPDFPEADFDLGNVYAEAGENEAAIKYYEAALRLRPEFADARSNLAVVLARRPSPETKN